MTAHTTTVAAYSLTESAKKLGISRQTLWRDITAGKLVAHRQNGVTLIWAADLLDYVLRHRGGEAAIKA